MKSHSIDFIKEKWINTLKFGFAYMFLQVFRQTVFSTKVDAIFRKIEI